MKKGEDRKRKEEGEVGEEQGSSVEGERVLKCKVAKWLGRVGRGELSGGE